MRLKLAICVLLAFSFAACNQTQKNEQQTSAMEDHANHDEHDGHQHSHAALSLNNGEKWASDISTRAHATAMIEKSEAFTKSEKTAISDYQNLANEMQVELNKLVADCKMDGPDHDALHLWLEPVVAEMKSLKEVQSEEEGKAHAEKLNTNLQEFNKYFN